MMYPTLSQTARKDGTPIFVPMLKTAGPSTTRLRRYAQDDKF
jgi:hypothetical protein